MLTPKHTSGRAPDILKVVITFLLCKHNYLRVYFFMQLFDPKLFLL